MGVTPDGRFVLMLNLTPATSVTAVDLDGKKVAGEIQTPGCSEILILGDRQFASVCADGSMLTTDFDDSAKTTSQKRTAKAFFDVEKDPVFQLPAMIDKKAYFVSYHGMVYPMDLSASPAEPGDTWSMLSDAEKKDGWRPGGWQPVAGYAPGHLIFVLMHQGGEWTQKSAGPEVWVYDVNDHKRVARIPMPLQSNAIRVSQDDNPLLFALVTSDSKLQIFSALKGRYLGTVNEVSRILTRCSGCSSLSMRPRRPARSDWLVERDRRAVQLEGIESAPGIGLEEFRARDSRNRRRRMDALVERLSRTVAQRTSRRGFLGYLGKALVGGMMIPLLPINRVVEQAHAQMSA